MDEQFIKKIEDKYIKVDKKIRSGDTVKVHLKITEAGKERTQIFDGVVLAINGKGISRSITVRKISSGVGVERIFPVNSTQIKKIEIIEKGESRRAKLYYMRKRVGKRSLDVQIDEEFKGEVEVESENSTIPVTAPQSGTKQPKSGFTKKTGAEKPKDKTKKVKNKPAKGGNSALSVTTSK